MNKISYPGNPLCCYRCKFKSEFVDAISNNLGTEKFCNLRRVIVYDTCKLYSPNWRQRLSNWLMSLKL
jgi:hypothetical protein